MGKLVENPNFNPQNPLSFNNFRHWLVSINDYSRKEKSVLQSGVDEDLISIDMQRYFKTHLDWFEKEAEQTILNIRNAEISEMITNLNSDVLLNQK